MHIFAIEQGSNTLLTCRTIETGFIHWSPVPRNRCGHQRHIVWVEGHCKTCVQRLDLAVGDFVAACTAEGTALNAIHCEWNTKGKTDTVLGFVVDLAVALHSINANQEEQAVTPIISII